MGFKKNQKTYNTQLMNVGKDAMAYLKNNLNLINQYTTNYADRTDFWTDKLNNRQLDLLSDKYLAQNASMLRGAAAFGSNSATDREIKNNAYSQNNYLADVANKNVMNANTLQNNELSALGSAAQIYQNSAAQGAAGAANVDAANNAWLNTLGKSMSTAGEVVSMFPGYGTAIGAALKGTGSAMSNMAGESQTVQGGYATPEYTRSQFQTAQEKWGESGGWSGLTGSLKNLFTGGGSSSSLSTDYSPSTGSYTGGTSGIDRAFGR